MKPDGLEVGQSHGDVRKETEILPNLFSLIELEILHQERRGQVNSIAMEHFKSDLFHKFGPTNQHYTCQSLYGMGVSIINFPFSLFSPVLSSENTPTLY